MLLGALMLQGVTPGPMITFEHPNFIIEVAAILLLASMAMWVVGMLLAKQVVKDFAVDADKVTSCPLGDGCEFSFQYDYARTWKYLVDTFREAGSHRSEIPLFVEYKPKRRGV